MRKNTLVALLACTFTPAVFAEVSPVATLYYAPVTASVPGLNGLMSVVLALLIFVGTFTLVRRKGSGTPLSTVAAVLATGLFAGAGGHLIADAYTSSASVLLTQPSGGSVSIYPGSWSVENQSGVSQTVQKIETRNYCGVSNDSSCAAGLLLKQGETCSIRVICT